MRAMRKVEAGHIHASFQQLLQNRHTARLRTQGAYHLQDGISAEVWEGQDCEHQTTNSDLLRLDGDHRSKCLKFTLVLQYPCCTPANTASSPSCTITAPGGALRCLERPRKVLRELDHAGDKVLLGLCVRQLCCRVETKLKYKQKQKPLVSLSKLFPGETCSTQPQSLP